MLMMQAVVVLQKLFSHQAVLPAAGGVFAGVALALSRSPARPFGIRESESLMNFSTLGRLRCICGTNHAPDEVSDRRQFCRSCGFEVVAVGETLLEMEVSKVEVRRKARELRHAAIRASHLELPASITCVEELQRYLSSDVKKLARAERVSSAVTVEQAQIQ